MALILCLNPQKKREIKMDNKNVLVALALSMSVLLFWAAFFETPRTTNNQTIEEKKTDTENILTPSLNESIQTKKITREKFVKF